MYSEHRPVPQNHSPSSRSAGMNGGGLSKKNSGYPIFYMRARRLGLPRAESLLVKPGSHRIFECGTRPKHETTEIIRESDILIRRCRIDHLLDSCAKSQAIEILTSSITSINAESIRKCVFSNGTRSGFHTWGLVMRVGQESLVLSTVVFRVHRRLGLVEVSLIASREKYRSSGLGSILLSKLISIWREEGLEYVVTFADLNAIRFFEAIGFTSSIPFPRRLYEPWIDKYSHSLFMCLHLHAHASVVQEVFALEPVEILVAIDYVGNRHRETWVRGYSVASNPNRMTVEYSFMLRNHRECLAIDSIRVREPVE